MADDDITVLIDDDLGLDTGEKVIVEDTTTGGDGPRVTKAKADDADPVRSLKNQVETLRTTATSEAARRAAAEERERVATERAARAESEAQNYKATASESEYGTILAGIDAAKNEGDVAERDYAAAMEAGDFKKAAEAQRRIARAEARSSELEGAKGALESSSKAAAARITAEKDKPAPARASGDPVEDYVRGRSPQTATWLRAHPEFITDPLKNHKLTAAHFDAVGENLVPDTDAYFKHVEAKLGIGEPVRQRRQSAPRTPVSNSGGGLNGGTREVTLSQGERESATDGTITWDYDDPSGQKRFKKGDPIGIKEFARRKFIMKEQGAYDKTLTQ